MTWLVGMITMADQVDQTFLSLKAAKQLMDSLKEYTSQMGMPLDLAQMSIMITTLTESWLNYWGFIIGFGLLAAPLIWYVSGWGFNLLIKWSGDLECNKTYGRMIFIYTYMVYCLPRMLVLLIETMFYKNDSSVLDVDFKSPAVFLLMLVFVILPFWSWINAYIAVRKTFMVDTKKSLFWFIGLPMVWYFFTLWQPLWS